MSLYLPEQKLGSRSGTDSSSHKFMLKGRQTGTMHRGHAWVFRAESRDTMLAWYDDIKNLTEKTGEERNAFVRQHARSVSGGNQKPASVSSDGAMDEDEADQVPYSATASQVGQPLPQQDHLLKRPQPGGRFPSDLNVNRNLLVPLSPSSGASSDDSDIVATAGAVPGFDVRNGQFDHPVRTKENTTASDAFPGGVLRKAFTGEKYTPTAQPLEHIGRQEQPAMHGSTQKTHARSAAAQPGPAHDETASRALPTGVSTNYSQHDTYIPIAQKAEYNNLPVHEGAYVSPHQGVVPGDAMSERAPDVLRDTSQHVPIAPQSEYFGFPVIPGAPEPGQQISAPRASNQQNSTQQASNQEAPIRPGVEYNHQPVQAQGISSDGPGAVSYGSPQHPQQPSAPAPKPLPHEPIRHDTTYGDWMDPKATGVAGVGAAKDFQRPQQHDVLEHYEEEQTQMLQQPQSEPVELDSTTSAAPAKLSDANGPESAKGLGVDAADSSNQSGVSSTVPTLKTDGSGRDALGEDYLASSGAHSPGDTTMAPPSTQAAGILRPSDAAESRRPGASGDDGLARPVSHFHVPGEFPPTPTAF